MGDIVYNDHVPKLYARARIFKFLTDDKFTFLTNSDVSNILIKYFVHFRYRIECTLEFCNNGSPCKERVFVSFGSRSNGKNAMLFQPPKCAYTKEEITNRAIRNQLEQSSMTTMQGTV